MQKSEKVASVYYSVCCAPSASRRPRSHTPAPTLLATAGRREAVDGGALHPVPHWCVHGLVSREIPLGECGRPLCKIVSSDTNPLLSRAHDPCQWMLTAPCMA